MYKNTYALVHKKAWGRTGYKQLFEPITVKPVCNDHLCYKIFYLWFIQ